MFVAGLSPGATAAIVTVPLLLIGAGIGALASQLGAVTVSSLPDDRAPEVGGIQNTATNLGASLGTALIGSILMAGLASSVVSGILANPDIPDSVKTTASVELESGVPFVSDTAAAGRPSPPPGVAAGDGGRPPSRSTPRRGSTGCGSPSRGS